ncbi:MAG: hypothetical protein Kow0068_12750 [Marinilabiliales bacterium]
MFCQNPLNKQNIVNKSTNPGKFTSLNIAGNCKIILHDADDCSLIMETKVSDIDKIKINCQDNILYITCDEDLDIIPVINIYIDKLKEIITHGFVDIECAINLTPNELNIYADFDSNIKLFLSSTELEIHAAGSGELYLEGDVKNIKIISYEEISIKCNLITTILTAWVNNSSSIIIKGNVELIKATVRDEGFLKAIDSMTKEAKIKVENQGDAQIYASEKAVVSTNNEGGLILKGKTKQISEFTNNDDYIP